MVLGRKSTPVRSKIVFEDFSSRSPSPLRSGTKFILTRRCKYASTKAVSNLQCFRPDCHRIKQPIASPREMTGACGTRPLALSSLPAWRVRNRVCLTTRNKLCQVSSGTFGNGISSAKFYPRRIDLLSD